MTRQNKSRTGKDRVSNVRIVDSYAGSDSAKLDRMISALQTSHSQTRVLCQETYNQNTQTASYVSTFSASNVRATDDFQSIAQQYETYRISAIRFDVYDIAGNNATPGFFSTWHDEILYGATPSFTMANVVDGPDSQIVPPGTGKISFTWIPKGTIENGFQSVTAASSPVDFGGIRLAVSAGASGFTANAPKFQIIMKAVVDFRGRV